MDIAVVLGGLVTGTAGAVEGRARVDARGSNVTAVLARDGIAGTTGGCWVGQGNGSRSEEGSQSSELHSGCFSFVINDWMKIIVDQIIFGLDIVQFDAEMAPYLG